MGKIIRLSKCLTIPESLDELNRECNLDKHERWLRSLIIYGFNPLYLGDEVAVSERWAGDGKNPDAGRTGRVVGIDRGMQSVFNIDYLVYRIEPKRGRGFEAYHYTLDLVSQAPGNELLIKLIRDTNEAFKRKFA